MQPMANGVRDFVRAPDREKSELTVPRPRERWEKKEKQHLKMFIIFVNIYGAHNVVGLFFFFFWLGTFVSHSSTF